MAKTTWLLLPQSSKQIMRIIFIALIFTAGTCIAQVPAYKPVDSVLYKTIFQQDSSLFEAFNSRNYTQFESFFDESLEIYQDNIGVRDYQASMDAFHGLLSGTFVLQRTLLVETLEVYPIKDFGAIETGQHRFCHFENGTEQCGTFKFVHIWRFNQGSWKIVKIVTYDHN